MKYKYANAIYIGRFQPIHRAHLDTIAKALEEAERLVIFVGSANRHPTIKNPWTFEQRVEIITDALVERFDDNPKTWSDKPYPTIMSRIKILPVRDYMYNDYKWVSEVQAKAAQEGVDSNHSTLLLGCEKDDSSYYLKMFPSWTFGPIPYLYNLDATDIRRAMFLEDWNGISDKAISLSTAKWIREWVFSEDSNDLFAEFKHYEEYHTKWAAAPFVPTFVTVDSIVMKSGCVLLIKRKIHPGKGLWALPGGFLESFEMIQDGALRELKQETNIMVPVDTLQSAIKDVSVFAHPKRSLRGRTITHVHLIDLGYGPLPSVRGGDDAKEAHWIPIADFYKMEGEMFEDHYDIVVNMISKY